MRNEGEPSVEEILDSIKKVIARDSREISRPAAAPAAVGGAVAPAAHDDFAPQDHDRAAPHEDTAAPSMAQAYAAHFGDDPTLEVAAPFTQDPYGDEGAVLDLSDIDFIDSAEDALTAHLQASAHASPAASSGFSSAFASVQNSLKAMGGAVYSPSANKAVAEPVAEPVSGAAPPPAAPYGGDNEALTGESSARSMRESLAALAKVAEPAAPLSPTSGVPHGETSLEGLVRDMLRPMLAQWLDQNLPDMVERLVKAEIERILQKR